MNIDLNLFGATGSQLSVYPGGLPGAILRANINSTANRLLTIERTGHIMTYTFYERLSPDDCIGFRISMNDMQLSRPKALMDYLSLLVDMLLAEGRIVAADDSGVIHFRADSLSDNPSLIETLRNTISSQLETSSVVYGCETLKGFPETNKKLTVSFKRPDAEIEALTYQSSRVEIDDRTGNANAYLRTTLHNLNSTIEEARQTIDSLKIENTSLLRQKKQYRIVMILFLMLAGAGVWLLSINNNLNDTRHNLSDANNRILNDSATISGLNALIDNQKEELRKHRNTIARYKSLATSLHSVHYLPEWHSTNHTHDSSSSRAYDFYGYAGDTIAFEYYVDSENADYLRYRISGPGAESRGNYSGSSNSGTVKVPISAEGFHCLQISYNKDGSVSQNSDLASVYDIHIIRGDILSLQESIFR